MRLMLRNWKLAPGWGVSACRPLGWNHWLPPSQHEKRRSPECALLLCQLSYRDVSPFFISMWVRVSI